MSKEDTGNQTSVENSWIRSEFSPILDTSMKKLHEKIPGLKADHLTLIGLIGNVVGSRISVEMEKKGKSPLPGAVISSIFTIFDALDGALARQSPTTPNGQLIDVGSDIIGETISGYDRAIAADNKHNKLGVIAACLSVATNSLPRERRALAQSRGYKIPEGGAGTRLPRTIAGLIAQGFPTSQPFIDFTITASNIKTALDRHKIATGNNHDYQQTLTYEESEKGKQRHIFIKTAALASVIGGGLIFVYHKHNQR